MKTVKKKRLSELVADEIKAYIKKENLKEGDRLPSISTLINILGIGRSSLREGLQLLEAQGTIEILNSKPFQIQTSFDIENERQFLLEALEVRTALEGKAVDLAAQKATNADIEKMEYHLKTYVQCIENNEREKANISDSLFHQSIYEAARNDLLKSIIDSVWDTFHEFWNEPFGIEDIFDKSYPYHEEMLQAIKDQNPKNASIAFQKIMDFVKTTIEKI
ncbi:GntR family transcriptional regulator, transcriptional repressor for pyruvate dehydrogenase complex [Salinibacillus kushneri]|uniref:GntR family transcriptional regulator, transcriptional repressor for pyruvate dehydrogenase complex n=1 Tax=Salinibacillus kushneri TaxID=237682 RepID=A0A1I0A7Y5_9BACI|nr:FadR/GntR family transcriptional regulator [Salinibacillus kushneri]SES89798.1 GntR family transcriptional regulator, transcriptional repressor for pyruvate dehydrogenase complex [Salinibacillus kushneri]